MSRHENPRSRSSRWKWWLRGIVALVLGMLLLRIFAFDIRRIPSRSMMPTLQGDDRDGDRVLVDLVTPRFRAPKRFEIVAFNDPHSKGRDLVKRVVGLPGESILLRDGDFRIHGEIYRKTPAERRRLRVPLFRSRNHPVQDGFGFESFHTLVTARNELRIRPEPGAEVPILSKVVPSDGFESDDGNFQHHSGEMPVWDLQLEVSADLKGETGELAVELTDEGDIFTFRLERRTAAGETKLRISRASILRKGAANVTKETFVLFDGPGPSWPDGAAKTFTFGNMDCSLFLEVDGQEFTGGGALPLLYPSHNPYISGDGIAPRSRTGVRALVRGSEMILGDLSIYRDILYEPKGAFGCQTEYRLGQNQYFVLGDFSNDSADSRVFGAVSRETILGYVNAILLPNARRRWLP